MAVHVTCTQHPHVYTHTCQHAHLDALSHNTSMCVCVYRPTHVCIACLHMYRAHIHTHLHGACPHTHP